MRRKRSKQLELVLEPRRKVLREVPQSIKRDLVNALAELLLTATRARPASDDGEGSR
jgi:hypothetical protein